MTLISFLICGLENRPWKSMADCLRKQIAEVGSDCEVLCDIDSGERSSGLKRQSLLSKSAGHYVAFVDDDDRVSNDYVSRLSSAAEDLSSDIIAFNMRLQIRMKQKTHPRMAFSSRTKREEVWKLGRWEDNRSEGKMSANHLCAWRKSIALKVAWCPKLGYGDDQLWYGPLHASQSAIAVHRIDSVLYEYDFCPMSTSNQTSSRKKASRKYFGSGIRCFMIEDEILIEDGTQLEKRTILARNRYNAIVEIDTELHRPFYTARLQ